MFEDYETKETSRIILRLDSSDHEHECDVVVTKVNPDTVYRFLNALLSFMHACGFSYIDRLEAHSQNKSWSTED